MRKLFLCFMILLTIDAIAGEIKFNSANLLKRVQEIGLKSGGPKGTYIEIARDIKKISKKSGFNVKVYEGGSLDNIRSVLWDKRYQFAMVQVDALYYANSHHEVLISNKGKKFHNNLKDKIKLLMPLYNEEIHIIVRKSSKIKTVSDLDGKIVNVDYKNSGSWVTAQNIKKANHLNWIETHYKPSKREGGKDVIDRLLTAEIDAIIWVVGEPVSYFKNLSLKKGKLIKFLNPDTEGYLSAKIEAKDYNWLEKDIPTQATKAVLITYNYGYGKIPRYNESAKLIEKFSKTINLNLLYLKKNSHKKWKSVNPYDYNDLKWPLHPLIKKAEKDGVSLILYGGKSKGMSIRIAQDIQDVCAGRIKINLKNGDSLKNINAVLADKSHSSLGIVQYDALLEKKKEESDLKDKVKVVAPLYKKNIYIVVRKSSKIKTVSDLNGKVVYINHKKSDSWVTAQNIKKANHLNWIETHYNLTKRDATKDVIDRLLTAEIDAIILVAREPVVYFKNLSLKKGRLIKFLHPDTEGYTSATIESKYYPWLKNDIPTQSIKTLLVSSGYKSQVQNIQLLQKLLRDNLKSYFKKDQYEKWNAIEFDDRKDIEWSFFHLNGAECSENCKTQECFSKCME